MEIIANFTDFNEKKRTYDSNTPINVMNDKYTKNIGNPWVVSEGDNVLNSYSLLSPFSSKNMRRARYFMHENNVIEIQRLHDRKQVYNEGNYTSTKYQLICVGNKRETTHLNAGLIFQLKKI